MPELEFEFSLRPDSDPELAPYVIEFIGRSTIWAESVGEEKIVGEIRGYKLDLAAAMVDEIEQAMLLDSVCPEVSEFSQTAFDQSGCHYLQEMTDGTLNRQPCSGLVYINEISVDPEYRGQAIGSTLMGKVGQMVDVENSLIALKAFPLSQEFGKRVPEESVARVKQFYERLGFTHVGGEFMVKQANLCDTIKKRQAWRRGQESNQIHPAQSKHPT